MCRRGFLRLLVLSAGGLELVVELLHLGLELCDMRLGRFAKVIVRKALRVQLLCEVLHLCLQLRHARRRGGL